MQRPMEGRHLYNICCRVVSKSAGEEDAAVKDSLTMATSIKEVLLTKVHEVYQWRMLTSNPGAFSTCAKKSHWKIHEFENKLKCDTQYAYCNGKSIFHDINFQEVDFSDVEFPMVLHDMERYLPFINPTRSYLDYRICVRHCRKSANFTSRCMTSTGSDMTKVLSREGYTEQMFLQG
ncbi:unnamed protein product [Nesidiocoris tenuis]|uniref:Uncharacterized protein n=1 Tax=Nesidiocoris tenuis TaxID=355587 RepID=A0A6H5HEE8_9HEMI|nr:unnamed protein product [Nesidiocoris tenuis]